MSFHAYIVLHIHSPHIHHFYRNNVVPPRCVLLLLNQQAYHNLCSICTQFRFLLHDDDGHQQAHTLLYPSRTRNVRMSPDVHNHLHVRSTHIHHFHRIHARRFYFVLLFLQNLQTFRRHCSIYLKYRSRLFCDTCCRWIRTSLYPSHTRILFLYLDVHKCLHVRMSHIHHLYRNHVSILHCVLLPLY